MFVVGHTGSPPPLGLEVLEAPAGVAVPLAHEVLQTRNSKIIQSIIHVLLTY